MQKEYGKLLFGVGERHVGSEQETPSGSRPDTRSTAMKSTILLHPLRRC